MDGELNPAQREAVQTPRGPLLVLAGAGTGKTRVVTCRIASLIRRGTRPSRILAVTFTNRAAAEMQQRLRELLGKKRRDTERPEISTFHAFCVRVLRRQIHHLGYPSQFAIYDRNDQESIARGALRQIRVSDATMKPADLIAVISRWKSASIRPPDAASAAESDKEHLAASAYRRYQDSLKARGAVDFDDLLLLVEQLFSEKTAVLIEEAARFDHLLIDEYQDTNASQYQIARALCAEHRNLCVVGDDDQSIYGWRGAEVAHILRFQHDWPDARVVKLEDNYRSSQPILEMANRLIVFNRRRHDKSLRAARPGGPRPRILQFPTAEDEAKGVVSDIELQLRSPGMRAGDFAILFRTNEQPRTFEMELRRQQLPYVLIGSRSFYDRKEVRDVMAYLRLLTQPQDEAALLRILNVPARGIGTKAAARLVEAAVSAGRPVWDLLPEARRIDGIPDAAASAMAGFRDLIDQACRELQQDPPSRVAAKLLDTVQYRQELERAAGEADGLAPRVAAVDDILAGLARHESSSSRPSLQGFLDDLLLKDRDEPADKDEKLQRNAVALMTLHSAKGLEFPQVYLVGMEEGLLPHRRSLVEHDRDIDEERRLCYVGITRAQDRLTFSLALTRRKWGKRVETQPSRFLFELTGQAESPSRASRGAR